MNNATQAIIGELTAAYARYSMLEGTEGASTVRCEAAIKYWEGRLVAAKAKDLDKR